MGPPNESVPTEAYVGCRPPCHQSMHGPPTWARPPLHATYVLQLPPSLHHATAMQALYHANMLAMARIPYTALLLHLLPYSHLRSVTHLCSSTAVQQYSMALQGTTTTRCMACAPLQQQVITFLRQYTCSTPADRLAAVHLPAAAVHVMQYISTSSSTALLLTPYAAPRCPLAHSRP